MRSIKEIQERFLKDNSSIRLGNLAANLSRIASFADDNRNSEIVQSILEESKHFIEWTASDYPLQIQSQLMELQIKLALWQRRWHTIMNDADKLTKIRNEAEEASKHLLKLAGIV